MPEVLAAVASSPVYVRHLVQAANAPQHGLQKEALWTLSNLVAVHFQDR